MSKKNPNFWPIIIAIAVFLIAITRGAIIPMLVFGYIFYKLFIASAFKDQGADFFEKFKEQFREQTIDLKPDKKGGFSTSSKTFSPIKMPKATHFILAIVGVLIIFVIIDGLVSVPAGHVAVIYDRGRGVIEKELPEGLHLKIPFWQVSTIFTTKKQVFTMAGEFVGISNENAVEGRSNDGQNVTVDVSVTYQIEGKNTPFLLQEFLSENGYRSTIISPAARSIVYDSISKFNALELVSEKRSDFSNLILEKLKETYGNNKIILHEIFVRNVTFSPEFARAIEEKQIAEQNIKTAENRKKEAEQLKEKKIIEAQAEAEAIRLKGETLKANPQVIQFEFVQKMAPNINWGILPDGALPLIDLKSLQDN